MALDRPHIGKRQLDDDSDEDAAAALSAGWRIDADDWWFRPKREGDRSIPGNDCCTHGDGPVLSPDARSAIEFDAAVSTKPL